MYYKKVSVIVVFLLCLVLFLTGCSSGRSHRKGETEQLKLIEVCEIGAELKEAKEARDEQRLKKAREKLESLKKDVENGTSAALQWALAQAEKEASPTFEEMGKDVIEHGKEMFGLQ